MIRPPISQYAKLPQLFSQRDIQDASTEATICTDRCKVISVDNNPDILQCIDSFLDRDYFQTFPVQDAYDVLDKIITVQPHLILMDIEMPNIDGNSLCRIVRSNQIFKNTPIIMVASNASLIDRAKAKISGATDYMTKPFTRDSLNQVIFRHLIHQ